MMWIVGGNKTDEKIVKMSFAKETGLTHPALSQLRAYWEGLRAGQELPARTDIDPRGIERALEYAFVAERIAPGVARFRLAGMHLNDLMGMEVRGMPLSCFFEPAAREEVQEQIERAFSEPAAVELHLESSGGFGRPAHKAKMILLPLRGEGGQVLRVLGGLVAEGNIGRTPRRFTLTKVEVQSTAEQEAAPQKRIAGFAETVTPFQNAPKVTRRHLSLVYSAD